MQIQYDIKQNLNVQTKLNVMPMTQTSPYATFESGITSCLVDYQALRNRKLLFNKDHE